MLDREEVSDGTHRKEVSSCKGQSPGTWIRGACFLRAEILQRLPKLRNSVQALHCAVHVARVAQILQTCTKRRCRPLSCKSF